MATENEKNDDEKTRKQDWMQINLGVITNLTNLSLGACLGFSAIALPVMTSPSNPNRITQEQASWIASTTPIAIPIGCILSGPILDSVGRKMTIQLVNIISFLGWLLICSAPSANSQEVEYPILIAGRAITGIATGLGSIPATVYLCEISTPKWRAVLATWTSVFIAIGVTIVYILGYFLQNSWRTTAIITTCLPVISFIAIFFIMPESPTWLINKNKVDQAEKSLSKIRCIGITSPKLKEEIEALLTNKLQAKDTSLEGLSKSKIIAKKIKYFLKPVCLKPFLIMAAFFFFQQASGTFVIVFYAVDFVKDAGVTIDPFLAAILLASSRIVATILVGMICRKYGRRPPTIISGALMTIWMVALSSYLYSINLGVINIPTQQKLNWLPVTLVVLYFFTSTFGFLTIPFAMIAEMFSTRARGVAGGAVACFCYIFNFVFVKTYLQMIESMGKHGVFCFYGAMALVGTVFVAIFLPETKGKTLQQIEERFIKRRNLTPEQTGLTDKEDV